MLHIDLASVFKHYKKVELFINLFNVNCPVIKLQTGEMKGSSIYLCFWETKTNLSLPLNTLKKKSQTTHGIQPCIKKG